MGSISVMHTMAPRAFKAVQQPFPTYKPRHSVTVVNRIIQHMQTSLPHLWTFVHQSEISLLFKSKNDSPLHNRTRQLVSLQTWYLWSSSSWQRQTQWHTLLSICSTILKKRLQLHVCKQQTTFTLRPFFSDVKLGMGSSSAGKISCYKKSWGHRAVFQDKRYLIAH